MNWIYLDAIDGSDSTFSVGIGVCLHYYDNLESVPKAL